MELLRKASVGTLESSDAIVSVSPGKGSLEIIIESIVMDQFGDDIRQSVTEVCRDFNITSAEIHIKDRGALDCTIRARVETALLRGGE